MAVKTSCCYRYRCRRPCHQGAISWGHRNIRRKAPVSALLGVIEGLVYGRHVLLMDIKTRLVRTSTVFEKQQRHAQCKREKIALEMYLNYCLSENNEYMNKMTISRSITKDHLRGNGHTGCPLLIESASQLRTTPTSDSGVTRLRPISGSKTASETVTRQAIYCALSPVRPATLRHRFYKDRASVCDRGKSYIRPRTEKRSKGPQ
jgi:hypothetical protein